MTFRFLIALLLCVNFTFAQTKKPSPAPKKVVSNFKIGYIFEDYVLDKYKEVKKLEGAVKDKQTKFQEDFNQMAIAYQTEYLQYQEAVKNLDTMTTEKLTAKLKSVQESKAKAEDFQRNAEKEIQELTGNGVQKIKADIEAATKQVSAAQGFKLVIKRNKSANILSSGNLILYAGDKGKGDLSDAVIALINK